MVLTRKELTILLLTWIFATSLNIFKPFHIDDAFHLEAAIYLSQNPLEPSDCLINWDQVPEPLLSFNQPPLFFYLLGLVGKVFSFSEVPLHLLISVFTFFALYFFYLTARLLKKDDAIFLTLVLGLSPAFLVNQNIMVDIPLLSCILGFGFFQLSYLTEPHTKNLIWSGVFLGFALLIKFTVLPLLIVFVFAPVIKRKFNDLYVVSIPFLFLLLWSVWNLFEYGQIQLLTRSSGRDGLKGLPDNILNFVSTLGAIAPFIIISAFASITRFKKRIIISIGVTIALICFFAASIFDLISAELSKEVIRYFFLLAGLYAVIVSIRLVFISNTRLKPGLPEDQKKIFLFLWFSAISLFIMLFAPFMATRHVLLVLPAWLLLLTSSSVKFHQSLKFVTVILTATIGLLLGLSDLRYARFYKEQALQIHQDYGEDNTLWSLGHWGWQWYSQKNHFNVYHTCQAKVNIGDLIVFPAEVPKQQLCDGIKVNTIEKRWDKTDFFSWFSTRYEASFYQSGYKRPAWKIYKAPNDTIYIQRVISIK